MIRFHESITVEEAARAAAAIGAKLVQDRKGGVIVTPRASRRAETTPRTVEGQLTYHRAAATEDGIVHLLQGGPMRLDGDPRYWGDLIWCRSEPVDPRTLRYTNGPVTCPHCLRARDEQLRAWRRMKLAQLTA